MSIEGERQRRRREHEELLSLLREEGVALREVGLDQRCLSCPDDASLNNRDAQGSDWKDSGARPLRHPEAEDRHKFSSPLTSEAWRDLLAALRRSLRLRQGAPIDEGSEEAKEGQRRGRPACSDVSAQVSLSPERSGDACRIVSRSEGNQSPATGLREGFATGGRGGCDANVEVMRL